jgi:hypothetical protein
LDGNFFTLQQITECDFHNVILLAGIETDVQSLGSLPYSTTFVVLPLSTLSPLQEHIQFAVGLLKIGKIRAEEIIGVL